jgi:hypothetical protein
LPFDVVGAAPLWSPVHLAPSSPSPAQPLVTVSFPHATISTLLDSLSSTVPLHHHLSCPSNQPWPASHTTLLESQFPPFVEFFTLP